MTTDGYQIVSEHWPYDGPYSPELTSGAAAAIERLVRYLNNATGKPSGALPFAATGGSVINNLGAAAHGLDQLLRQLEDFFERQAWDDPTLYDDRRDPVYAASETAHAVVANLVTARRVAADVAKALDSAAGHASHLGNDVPG